MVSDTMRFQAALPLTLREGVPQEKLGALRQCIERIGVQNPIGEIKISLRSIPVGQGNTTAELIVSLFDVPVGERSEPGRLNVVHVQHSIQTRNQ